MTTPFIPYRPKQYDPDEMLRRSQSFEAELEARRSVRHFSDKSVPKELIESAIRTASTAPSGAHKQPWKFVAVSDPNLKSLIRSRVEDEEKQSYTTRMSDEWKEAIRPMGTDWQKPYLEIVPWIVVVFEETFAVDEEGKHKNYYVKESVGIACGLFIAALHHMGLATLTHTPSPMNFLGKVLERPSNERAFILFPIGYPAEDAEVPDLTRKPLEEIATFHN
ncbi:MAG: nitroreductase family protein [Planctomycetota bacterium]